MSKLLYDNVEMLKTFSTLQYLHIVSNIYKIKRIYIAKAHSRVTALYTALEKQFYTFTY